LRRSRSSRSESDALPAPLPRGAKEVFLPSALSAPSQPWWTLTRGDIDATITQVGCIVAQMFIPVLLVVPLGVSLHFSLQHFVPGFASGLLLGSGGLAWLGVRLARRESRRDVTAHPYGNNVPAILAYTLSIFLPVYLQTHDADLAWRIGAAAVVWTGIIKLIAAPFAGAFRRYIPLPASMTVFGAAMYSYLAMVLLQRVFDQPLVGIVALAIVCVAVFAGVPITSYRLPPFLVAWIVPLILGIAVGYVHPAWTGASLQLPFVHSAGPLRAMILAVPYLSVIAPMSLYHILQDVASVEGAASAGDNYDAQRGGLRRAGHLGGRAVRQHRLACCLRAPSSLPRARRARWLCVLDSGDFSGGGDEWRGFFHFRIVSVADSGGDDRLRFRRSRHGHFAARGAQILERGDAGIDDSGWRCGFRGA
jgi:hypothetical protein